MGNLESCHGLKCSGRMNSDLMELEEVFEWNVFQEVEVLFELGPTVSHTGPQKEVNNIKSCLKVMNEWGGFVCHYRDEV